MTKDNQERIARLKNIVLNMPEKPGSYQFYDKDHTIIYVGKAKRLKSRVASYFHTEVARYTPKVHVTKLSDISYTGGAAPTTVLTAISAVCTTSWSL